MQTVSTIFINGQPVEGGREPFPVNNPATGEAFAQCPAATPEQVDEAVAAAQATFKTFQHTPDAELKAMLHRIADLIDANADELARVVTLEQGKPLALAQMEVGAAAGWTRYTADLEVPVKVIEDSETRLAELHHKPLGVVGSITPWNWPLMIAVWHIMPAIRTGNTVVSKPSSLTPFSTLKLVELINQVVPAGVINIVTGEGGIGRAMTSHQDINKIVFTGSTPTGQDIMRKSADNLKRLTLELGGNDASIVLPGTDLDKIAQGIFQTAFLNMGQTCAALKRLYVHEDQYDEMCAKLVELASEQVVGSGLEEGVTFGPVQNKAQLDLVAELVDDARAQGGRVLCGGEAQQGNGFFYPPTIVAGVSNGVRLVDEEQFGPALPIIAYSTVEEALAMANDNVNGLGGSVWGDDIEQARAVATRLESGTAWINNHAEVLPHCPFGGSKMSGVGIEFGEEGLLEYTQPQLLSISRG